MDIDKDIKTGVLTDDGLITNKPCWVYSIFCTSGAGGIAWTIYNGVDANGEKRFVFSTVSTVTVPLVLFKPMYFPNGIYCDKTTDAVLCIIQYKEEY